jgi:hypothetical protein
VRLTASKMSRPASQGLHRAKLKPPAGRDRSNVPGPTGVLREAKRKGLHRVDGAHEDFVSKRQVKGQGRLGYACIPATNPG